MTLLTPMIALALAAVDAPGQTPLTPMAPIQAPVQPPATVPSMRPLPVSPLAPEAAEVWHLTLHEAIRLGLTNSEVIRVVATGTHGVPPAGYTAASLVGPTLAHGIAGGNAADVPPATVGPNNADIVISRLNDDASIWTFKAAIMAHVRSIEQQYWALSQQIINLWARETAVRIGQELMAAAKARPMEPKIIAEIEQQLENFRLNLVTATSDLIMTERQLRNILGLSAGENRRIVPATAPTEAKVDPNWDLSVKQMHVAQPDIALQRELLAGVIFQAVLGSQAAGDQDQREQQQSFQRDRQQAFLRQIIQQTTHSLARFFLEVDANYKQFQTAQRLRAAAQQRLETQRAAFGNQEGTVDRMLDAVSQYATAIAQEAQFKASYNTSLAAFEESRGTLLTYEGVTVTLEPSPKKQYLAPNDAPTPAKTSAPTATTYKLRASVGGWNLLNVEVEVNQAAPATSKP